MIDLPDSVKAHVKKLYEDEIKKEKRKWVLELDKMLRQRYDEVLKRLNISSISVNTLDDTLYISLWWTVYLRIKSYLPENNPFFPIYKNELKMNRSEKNFSLNKKEIKKILDDIFWWADVLSENADFTEKIKDILKNAERKYPKELFIKANKIYEQQDRKPGEGKYTYDTALEKALMDYKEFENIRIGSDEFPTIRSSYKKFRNPQKSKKKVNPSIPD